MTCARHTSLHCDLTYSVACKNDVLACMLFCCRCICTHFKTNGKKSGERLELSISLRSPGMMSNIRKMRIYP